MRFRHFATIMLSNCFPSARHYAPEQVGRFQAAAKQVVRSMHRAPRLECHNAPATDPRASAPLVNAPLVNAPLVNAPLVNATSRKSGPTSATAMNSYGP